MIRKISKTEMQEVYFEHMIKDFPKAELKKWSHIEEMLERGIYFAYGYYKESKLLGYAFFIGPTDRSYLLLDYYAVTEAARGQGVGGEFLQLWRQELATTKVVIGEVEDPAYAADEEELAVRNRRLSFYKRSGLKVSGIESVVFGVEYKVIYLPITEEQNDEQLAAEVEAIYHLMFPQKYPDEKISIKIV